MKRAITHGGLSATAAAVAAALTVALTTPSPATTQAAQADTGPPDNVVQDEDDFVSIEEDRTGPPSKRKQRALARQYQLADDQVCTATSGGVIRFDRLNGNPRIYVNSSHVAVGLNRVGINHRGDLEIKHTGGAIVTIYASPDETLVARGIDVGLSGGSGTTNARFYDSRIKRRLNLNNSSDWKRVYGRYSNLWVGFTHITPC